MANCFALMRGLFWCVFLEMRCNEEINTKITLEWVHTQFVTRAHTLFFFSYMTFYCLPLSSLCKTAHGHWPHVNVCRMSCGGVFNMLVVLSITFFFHYNIWGCMCSSDRFHYRWFKRYIYSSCYYHNKIGSIHLSHCYHIFPWFCVWDVCYILFCYVLHIHSGKTVFFLFSLLLCSLWWV